MDRMLRGMEIARPSAEIAKRDEADDAAVVGRDENGIAPAAVAA
jgi:hypothetical protein